ncbi:uncharacterized protein EI90DRAFT_3129926 [Cantharellus anzutake]|uniref:uncharacterized protein n=1 Tax=Cantharellus anzutake TaxID=1750568 RepID=UPI0019031A0B|nr:uncharacterized protein EI90DRAFT_3129926 [Cantharellus anzutake]KAF8324461.1 hypothetical protein EI90DRAFT_3129926 [Cantharellus anzutake]
MSDQNLRDFILKYPYPAFVLDAKPAVGHLGPSLKPSLSNKHFRRLLRVKNKAHALTSWLELFGSVDDVKHFTLWVFGSGGTYEESQPTFTVNLVLSWARPEYSHVKLQLIKTAVPHEVWVITSLPLSPLPPSSTPESTAAPVARQSIQLPVPVNLRIPHPRSISATPDLKSSGNRPLVIDHQDHTFHPLHTADSGVSPEMIQEHKQLFKNFPWHETALGAPETWPVALHCYTSYMLDNPYPKALWWGQEYVFIYNAAYAAMCGKKHPGMFGQTGPVAWQEIWEMIGPLADSVLNKGNVIAKQDDLLFFDKLTAAMLPEETYHSWSYVPVISDDGKIAGFLNSSFETTGRVMAERRLQCLRHLGERSALASTTEAYCQAILDVFSATQVDAPFAALYYIREEAVKDHDEMVAGRSKKPLISALLQLAGTVGIPAKSSGNPLAHSKFRMEFGRATNSDTIPKSQREASISLSTLVSNICWRQQSNASDDSGSTVTSSRGDGSSDSDSVTRYTVDSLDAYDWRPWIAEASRQKQAILVPSLPLSATEGVGKNRGWNDTVRDAIVIPISAEGRELDQAVLILGVNTRAPYNREYASWIDVVRMTLSSALTAVLSREAETQRANQLAQLDAAKTAFFSNASHELRTPLTLITAPLQDAIRSVDNRKVKDHLQLAARNAARLSRLVDSLMDFSKIEGGKLLGRYSPVMLASFTSDLAALFRSTIEKSNIEYRVECDPADNRIAYVDPELWEKVVFNLIGNAFKYTLEGSIIVKVEFDSGCAMFSVRDTGVGIPSQDLDKGDPISKSASVFLIPIPCLVFDRFHRVEATSRSQEGTGIGLSLTRELVRLHGGTVEVQSRTAAESNDGSHGTTFTVLIPTGNEHIPLTHLEENSPTVVTPQRVYARGIIDEAAQWGKVNDINSSNETSNDSEGGMSTGSVDSGTLFFMQSDIILIVDDNADMRKYMKSLFVKYCTVLEASNGQEALDMMHSAHTKPHIVVADQMMPVLDGISLLAAMKACQDLRLIPVVMVTAASTDDQKLEGLLSGADDYIAKPFAAKHLVARTHLQLQIGKRRVELDAKFKRRTSELRALSELAPVGIFRADMDGTIVYANPKWHELTGHPSDRPLSDWTECVVDEHRNAVIEAWDRLFEDHLPVNIEFTFKSGRTVQAQIGMLDHLTTKGMGAMGTLTDISERRMLQEAQLAHAEEREAAARQSAAESELRRQEAEDRRRAQELLIDVTSHELRQPVSAILNCASLIRSNFTKLRKELEKSLSQKSEFRPDMALLNTMDEDLEALDAIYQCGLSQERIANDVLSLSRIQLEVLSILPVDFVLADEVRRVCSLFNNELSMKNITFMLTFGESIGRLGITHVRLDKARFAQIMTNLLSNAIKFTDISHHPKRVIHVNVDVACQAPADSTCLPPSHPEDERVSTNRQRIFLYLSVRDSGPGLKPEDLALLFQRFAQGSNSHEVFGGSGLGLFVSRKLCELMGGRIEVSSEYGRGATFRFFVQGESFIPPIPPAPAAPGQESKIEVKDPAPVPLRVLITEDNQINQTVLNRQLRRAGCLTTLASDGVEAIRAIKELYTANEEGVGQQFDVILMDCEMPVMNGYDATREIRKMESEGLLGHRNYIVALTGNAREAQVRSALDAGMDSVTMKPYKLEELLKTMRINTAHHQQQSTDIS